MGMDFVAIIANKYTKAEILELPKVIDNSKSLREQFSKRHQKDIDHNPKHYNRRTNWSEKGNRKMTESNLERIWKHFRDDTEIQYVDNLCVDVNIDAYFGWLNVHENTISITLFPEHKYRNLRNPMSSKYVFKFIRELTQILNADKIVFCCDSYYHPSILEEKSRMGYSINELISLGVEIFGEPPKELNAAIENLFFIDEFDLNLEELDPEKEVWSRAKYEYEKENKGEPPYKKAHNDHGR